MDNQVKICRAVQHRGMGRYSLSAVSTRLLFPVIELFLPYKQTLRKFNRMLQWNWDNSELFATVNCDGLFLHLMEQQHRDQLCHRSTKKENYCSKGGWKSLQTCPAVLSSFLLIRWWWMMFFTMSLPTWTNQKRIDSTVLGIQSFFSLSSNMLRRCNRSWVWSNNSSAREARCRDEQRYFDINKAIYSPE